MIWQPSFPEPSKKVRNKLNSRHIIAKAANMCFKSENPSMLQTICRLFCRSEWSIRDYCPDVRTESEESSIRSGGVVSTIECVVGEADDCGKLRYLIQNDGRTYELKCSNGRSVLLNFSKKVLLSTSLDDQRAKRAQFKFA